MTFQTLDVLRTVTAVGVAVVTVGCGGGTPASGGVASATAVSVTAALPTSTAASRPARAIDDHQPRLIGEPILIRLLGTPKPSPQDGSPQLRYALILRSSAGLRPGSPGLGHVLVRNQGLGLYPRPPFASRKGVFCGIDFLEGEGAEEPKPTTASNLDSFPAGTTLPLHIKLFGQAHPRPSTVRRVPLIESRLRATPTLPTGLASPVDFLSPRARGEIRKLGCG